MATVSSRTKKGGFNCEFVEKPPAALQSKCSICKLILCEPYQVSCCGTSFCRDCIEKKRPCPTCKEETFVSFHNKGLQISLYTFHVYCSHKQEGCEWKGELGQLDNHLNLPPQPDKQLEGCEYSETECIYCSELIKNPDIAVHQNDLCPKRPFSCEHCFVYKSHHEDVVHNHWPVCGSVQVQCPNECGTSLLRKSLEHHITKDCPNRVTNCHFHLFGCNVRLPFKDMPAHLEADYMTHMSLQAASYKVLQEKVGSLERENESLKSQLVATQRESQEANAKVETMQDKIATLQLSSEDGIRALKVIEKRCMIRTYHDIDITMDSFEQHKRDGSVWYSPAFYSHPRGYKFCLRVHANGHDDGIGAHVSAYVHLMKGEFDDDLTWPFRGTVTIRLRNHIGNAQSATVQANVHVTEETAQNRWTRRVIQGERNEVGWGYSQFISHRRLGSGFLRNNCLYFCVSFKSYRIADMLKNLNSV